MSLTSIGFAALAVALLVVATPLPGAWRRVAILAASGFFLSTWLDLSSGLALAGFAVFGYGATLVARRVPRIVPLILVVLVAAFLVVKRYDFLPRALVHHELAVVGISYVLFRQIQVLVDASEEQVPELDFASYAAFLLAFWTLLAGPIQRYQEFLVRWRALGSERLSVPAALERLERIALGYVKLAVLGNALLAVAGPPTPWPLWREAVAFYAYPAYVYFNFSGYCDIVIGLASALGFELPENFDEPWRARNVLDFWNRWHVTLSSWLKAYLFNPLVKAGLERFPERKLAVGAAAYGVTFFVAGVWHGSTWNFAIFGAFHALGAAGTKLYDETLKSRLGREGYKRYQAHGGARAVATVLTFHWTALSFVFFRRNLGELQAAWTSLTGGPA